MVKLVGILNVTPDSFSDGGQFLKPEKAIAHAEKLLEDGASFIDVGAESTRPQAVSLSHDEEWARLGPILEVLLHEYPGMVSLDSYHPETIRRAFQIGPVIVNDITGFRDRAMIQMAVEYQAKVIVSHLPNMSVQEAHAQVPVSTIEQVRTELLAKAALLEQAGLPHGNIILDPGIGFGKTIDLNKRLLTFGTQVPDYPVMIGYSRKRFLGDRRMDPAPNLAAAKIAIAHNASYLRVHDVAAHMQLLRQLI